MKKLITFNALLLCATFNSSCTPTESKIHTLCKHNDQIKREASITRILGSHLLTTAGWFGTMSYGGYKNENILFSVITGGVASGCTIAAVLAFRHANQILSKTKEL